MSANRYTNATLVYNVTSTGCIKYSSTWPVDTPTGIQILTQAIFSKCQISLCRFPCICMTELSASLMLFRATSILGSKSMIFCLQPSNLLWFKEKRESEETVVGGHPGQIKDKFRNISRDDATSVTTVISLAISFQSPSFPTVFTQMFWLSA